MSKASIQTYTNLQIKNKNVILCTAKKLVPSTLGINKARAKFVK